MLRDFERDDGELSKKILEGARALGMEFDDDDVEELVEKFGRRGVVKSRKFLEAIEEDRESDDDDKVTRACKGKEKKLKKAFERVDEDEEGRVSRKKFSRVLEDVGVDLTSRDLRASQWTSSRSATRVDYGKFLKSIAADDDDDDDVFGAIKSALKEAKEDGEEPMKVFEKMDRDSRRARRRRRQASAQETRLHARPSSSKSARSGSLARRRTSIMRIWLGSCWVPKEELRLILMTVEPAGRRRSLESFEEAQEGAGEARR